MDHAELTAAAAKIRNSASVVAMTGAGVSTASGIPDFRSDDGIWKTYDPSEFHISNFRADPEEFWNKRLGLVEDIFGEDIGPNAAHDALAGFENAGYLDTLVTQNIDGLHREAGNDDPIEIHGNGRRAVCTGCNQRSNIEPALDRIRDGESPPTCGDCESILKPDVVLFGERLPESQLHRARSAARNADVFLAIGSSLTVEPAASLPRHAVDNGATFIIVNLGSTDLSGRAHHDFREDVTELLPVLFDAVTDSA